ncbi:MAG: FAD-dependent oxidoreductase [Deltaproteobacteria bacterium]|nr:FAD-dependent oxidoreductase [Deltaproteobacteria bacterium]
MEIFTPIDFGGVTLKNRIVMPAMATNFGNPDGSVTERLIGYYAARAAGGVGLIVIEFTAVSFEGRFTQNQIRMDNDCFIGGHGELVEAIHRAGARAVLQLHHSGRRAPLAITFTHAMGPSAVPVFPGFPVPRPMTIGDIGKIRGDFVSAAVRAAKAGYDGVEIHAAHGYLLAQFLSPESNRREDEYGGSPEKRAKLPLEILQGIKDSLGPDFPVIVKMSGDEYTPGGIEIEEALIHARLFEEAGADMLCVSGSAGSMMALSPNAPGRRSTSPPVYVEQACFAHLAAAVKTIVSIPVMAIGRINDPSVAERLIEEGAADVIAVGRGHIADPAFVNKSSGKNPDPLCRCIGCLQGCIERSVQASNTGITCAVNPRVGRELEAEGLSASSPKRFFVLGGGPSGMHAAAILAERGHRVDLYEKRNCLGGNVLTASKPPHKAETMYLIDYLVERLKRSEAKIHLNADMTAETIKEEQPDAVIVCCGSKPRRPSLPGMESAMVVTADDVLSGTANIGKPRRVAVVGGGLVGCETALYLAERGWRVTVLEMLEDIGIDVGPIVKHYLRKELEEAGVTIRPKTCIAEFRKDSVVCRLDEGETELFDADIAVLAVGYSSDDGLFRSLQEYGVDAYIVGDARSPRKILDAMRESDTLARNL